MSNISILTANFDEQYQLIDSGNGYKLEKFGNNVIMRPDSNCVWQKIKSVSEWNQASAIFKSDWTFKNSFKKPWQISYNELKNAGISNHVVRMHLRATSSKNIGIFPEQSAHWLWTSELIAKSKKQPNVLNLFAYTGGATLCAAAAGAKVCHVDASKAAVTWASQNQELSELKDAQIRWIVDDCAKFLTREIKRGTRYDAIIMDPPAFGRDQKGKVFEFEKQILNLLILCKQALSNEPLFFIFNGYSMGYSATVLKNLLQDLFKDKSIQFGELQIQEVNSDRNLPCSLYARF
jgi:23S rRNA (cytosine1962-C5)-methyltransferase